MAASLGTVHTAALGAVAVVKQLGGQAGQFGALVRLEYERRHCGSVLSEVHHQGIAGIQPDNFSGSVFFGNDNLAVFLFAPAFHSAPGICKHRFEGKVGAAVDLSTGRGENLSGEFIIDFGGGELFGRGVAGQFAGVVFFAVKDGRVLDRTGCSSQPMFCIGAEQFFCSVFISEFQYAPECALLANHSLIAGRRDYLVCPPAGGYLHRKLVLGAGAFLDDVTDIVGVRYLRLFTMCKARLENLLAYYCSVYVKFINAKSGGHPLGPGNLLTVGDRGQEPAGAVGGTAVLAGLHFSCHNRGVGRRNPLRNIPGAVVKRIRKYARIAGRAAAGDNKKHQPRNGRTKKMTNSISHKNYSFPKYTNYLILRGN